MNDEAVSSVMPQLDRLFLGWLEKARLPGLAVGIVSGQDLVWSGGYGYADIGSRRKPDALTISRVASITKTFTAAAILQLRDEGLLTLEDPLVLHIPEFSGADPRAGTLEDVSIKRMLTHRAGLVTEPPLPGWDALKFPSMKEIVNAFPDTAVAIPQDSAFKYSNLAFALLGEVIARLKGQPYAQYVKENVFEPLDMTYSDFEPTGVVLQHLAAGYSPSDHQDMPVNAPYAHMRGMTAAAQLHSNVTDLAKWVSFQFRVDGGLRRGAQVLDGRTLEEMHRPVYVEQDWSAGQALGWRATRIGDRVYHGHGGGIHGFASHIAFNKPSKTGAIVLTNMWPATAAVQVAHAVLELILDADAEAARNACQPVPPPVGAVPDNLAQYLGRYRAEPGVPVLIEYRGGALRFVNPDPSGYTLHAPATLETTAEVDIMVVRGGRGAGEYAMFARDEAGQVASFSLGGFVFRKLR